MRKFTYAVVACALAISSCSDEKKLNELQNRIESLEKELDDCKNGEDKLIGEIRNYYKSNNFKEAAATYTKLVNKYPGTKYIDEAKEIHGKSIIEINRIHEESAKKKAAEDAAKKMSLTKLKKKFDDVKGINWYSQRYFTHYTNSNRSSLYFGHIKGNTPNLRLQMTYTGDDWIFFEKAYLSYDGNTKEVYFDRYKERESDNGDGGVWEWLDVAVDDSEVNWFKDFASSPNAKMRMTGKYEKTRTLTSQERQGMLDVISGYEYLKENKN